jgi:hypothetical protein
MPDYTYPSIFLAYLFFALMLFLAVFFCIKSAKDGYWGKHGEDLKYGALDEEPDERSKK